MSKILEFLDGKKSYIGAAIVFIAGGLWALKIIDDKTFQVLVTIGGSVSVVGIRSALKKLE